MCQTQSVVLTQRCKVSGAQWAGGVPRSSQWSAARLERGRAGLRPRPQSALSDPPGGKPKPHRPPWPGSSTGEVTPWGFLGVFLLRGQDLATWACGAIGRGVGAGRTHLGEAARPEQVWGGQPSTSLCQRVWAGPGVRETVSAQLGLLEGEGPAKAPRCPAPSCVLRLSARRVVRVCRSWSHRCADVANAVITLLVVCASGWETVGRSAWCSQCVGSGEVARVEGRRSIM